MEEDKFINSEVSMNKIYLSSETKIYKTERFFYQTKKLAEVDNFVLKLGERIMSYFEDCKNLLGNGTARAFKVQTFDKRFSFKFVFGYYLNKSGIEPKDIIFYEDSSGHEGLRTNDQRISAFIKVSKVFAITIRAIGEPIDEGEFSKLYYLSTSSNLNIPVLDDRQRALVEIENQNVLVQGVAGSGKTNVCLSKILFVMGKNYSGKILYTTFSRALLLDTKSKIDIFKNSIEDFIDDYLHGKLIFLDRDHIKATENRLGIKLVYGAENIVKQLNRAVEFLQSHVDFCLIEDLYRASAPAEFLMSDEKVFIEKFLNKFADHQLRTRLGRIKDLPSSIIYKEIYGLVCGSDSSEPMLSFSQYVERREGSFGRGECETIYEVAKRYLEFQKTQNYEDNNTISRKLLQNIKNIPKYSLAIVDEVQDLTQINLTLLHEISLKMFCVGDALQMINPSYFSFAYLKNLMYREDVTDVAELEYNYRNNKKISEIVNKLSDLNTAWFGTHSFVLHSKSIEQDSVTNVIYVEGSAFAKKLQSERFENFTILVTDMQEKQRVKQLFKRQEVLTISEVKGLERDTVLLYNILSSNAAKWQSLQRLNLSHKTADENSVYRYYFNLFYVGVSRAKHNIIVLEEQPIDIFKDFFLSQFENLDAEEAYLRFNEIISKIDIDDDEIEERIEEFIKLGQFDNARFYANKFDDSTLEQRALVKIEIFETLVFKGKNREAGIKFWNMGLTEEAKRQFEISGDRKLIQLLNNLKERNKTNLDIEVVKYLTDFQDDRDALELIFDIVRQDLAALKQRHTEFKGKIKRIKERKNG